MLLFWVFGMHYGREATDLVWNFAIDSVFYCTVLRSSDGMLVQEYYIIDKLLVRAH